MSKIDKLIEIGFKINWNLIKIGYLGRGGVLPQISKEEVCNYGYYLIENNTSEKNLIIDLIDNSFDNIKFSEILCNLSNREYLNDNFQIKKWIVYLVKNLLENLPNDYFDGLLEITDFWISLDIDFKNCPHTFQGVNNNIIPEEYYTQEMYNKIINEHKEWLKSEILGIINNEI